MNSVCRVLFFFVGFHIQDFISYLFISLLTRKDALHAFRRCIQTRNWVSAKDLVWRRIPQECNGWAQQTQDAALIMVSGTSEMWHDALRIMRSRILSGEMFPYVTLLRSSRRASPRAFRKALRISLGEGGYVSTSASRAITEHFASGPQSWVGALSLIRVMPLFHVAWGLFDWVSRRQMDGAAAALLALAAKGGDAPPLSIWLRLRGQTLRMLSPAVWDYALEQFHTMTLKATPQKTPRLGNDTVFALFQIALKQCAGTEVISDSLKGLLRRVGGEGGPALQHVVLCESLPKVNLRYLHSLNFHMGGVSCTRPRRRAARCYPTQTVATAQLLLEKGAWAEALHFTRGLPNVDAGLLRVAALAQSPMGLQHWVTALGIAQRLRSRIPPTTASHLATNLLNAGAGRQLWAPVLWLLSQSHEDTPWEALDEAAWYALYNNQWLVALRLVQRIRQKSAVAQPVASGLDCSVGDPRVIEAFHRSLSSGKRDCWRDALGVLMGGM